MLGDTGDQIGLSPPELPFRHPDFTAFEDKCETQFRRLQVSSVSFDAVNSNGGLIDCLNLLDSSLKRLSFCVGWALPTR